MDRDGAHAFRALRSSGRMVEWLVEIIAEIPSDDCEHIHAMLKWRKDRLTRTWNLGGQHFAIGHLPDSVLREQIDTLSAHSERERWMTRSQEHEQRYYGRSKWSIIAEEAESRGLLSQVQQHWYKVMDSPVLFKLRCCKSVENNVLVDGYVVCAEHREKKSCEEIVNLCRSALRGRFCRVRKREH